MTNAHDTGVVESANHAKSSGHASSAVDDSLRVSASPQVAPLPRTANFHVGTVLGDANAIIKASHEDEERYIPVALARAHLERVVHDMHAMKADQTAKMNQILDKYKTIEAETKRYYETHITELKRKAKDKFRVEQARYTALETEIIEQQQLAQEEIVGFRVASDERRYGYEQERLRWREDVERLLLQYEEELTRLHNHVQRQIDAALQLQADSVDESHTVELTRLEQKLVDERAESMRVVEETTKTLQKRLVEAEAVHARHIQRLQWDAQVEMETSKCLAVVVNRVVDMEDHLKRRKRSRELKSEIASLAMQMEVAMAKEQSLTTQLGQLQMQYKMMEQQAVDKTMETMLAVLEMVALTASEFADGKREQSKTVQSTEELIHAKPHMLESEAQTQDWTTLLAAHARSVPSRSLIEMHDASVEASLNTHSRVEKRDIAVETTPEDTPAQAELQPIPSLPMPAVSAAQLKYEADAERFKDRNAELVRSKTELKTLKTSLQNCLDQKNDAKARIKQWLADFQKQHARDPTIEEKAQVKDLYLAFKVSEEAYNAAKDQVAKAKGKHHELVVEIEALSQWHALTASARESSRGGSAGSERRSESAGTSVQTPTIDTDAPILHANDEAVKHLTKEIDTLRAELKVAQAEKKKADDDVEFAVLEAKQAKADAKETADRLALAEAKALELKTRVDTPVAKLVQEKAEQKSDGDDENHVEQRKAELHQNHREQVETYSRESEAMERQRIELCAQIASLQEEIAARAAEKETLEKHIEQLRLHAELMDGHIDDDDSMLLESDAKGAGRRETPGEQDENENHGSEGDELGYDTAEHEAEDIPTDTLSSFSPMKTISKADRLVGQREEQLIAQIKDAIESGKAQWNRGDKAKCFQIYVKMCEKCIETLRVPPPGRREEVGALKSALQEAGRLPPAKGSMVLRRQLDNCLAACEARAKDREAQEAAAALELAAAAKSPSTRTTPSSSPQRKTPHKKSIAPSLNESAGDGPPTTGSAASTPVAGKAIEEYKQKLKALETKAKADKVRITQLEVSLSKVETQLMNASSSGGGSGGGANAAILERKLAETEKKHAKALEEAEKSLKKEITAVTQQLSASQTKSQSLQEQVDKLTKELTVVGGRATQLTRMEEEVTVLRAKAAQVDALSQDLVASKGELTKLELSYKEEQALRKKYYNMIEDMKGKIRVYARCRPMSSSETERGCEPCVRFVDEFSLELKTSHGPKMFAYDQVFPPASSQDQVFEDTKNLLQSAVDGYNVCIFAYGQTGSGKTFTMTGSESLPGLSPRAIHHLFRLAEESKANNVVTFQAFMLELYNDALIDLFYLVDGGGHDAAPKLDIKKNDRGMVFVSNITTKSCTSAQQTLKLFEAANKKRQVGATKMNAESSRSHSVFSILVENYNKTTKTTSIGKLSLVDLAGSERAGKTGATNERLKEAQAINKSLSALGDVIAALSAGEKFIPYRNNKLTQLMQDSLGGNAKTLMFVNISPADYNQEETQTSLQYASRVKLITNNANKTSESETVSRLKQIIKNLRAGKTDVELDGLGLE